jgi:hypothetical protein
VLLKKPLMHKIVAGITYNIDHLEMFSRKVEVPLRGFAKKKILVEFRFSNHCFSRGPSQGEEIPPGFLIPDGSTKMPRNRIFDPRRYHLSTNLVSYIDALIASEGEVRKSRHDNFFCVTDVHENTDGVLTTVNYYIFMSARKVAEPNQEKRIRVYVESAYPESPDVPAPNFVAARSFPEVLGEIWSSGKCKKASDWRPF